MTEGLDTAPPSDDPDLDPSERTTVKFTLPAEIDAQFASVVGDFNDWDPTRGEMERDAGGLFSCSVDMLVGRRYQYRFLLDGDRWMNDWSAHAYAPNRFGGEDSVLDLTAEADRELAAARVRTPAENSAGATERADDGMAPLINNTGDDGGAATG